MSTTIDPNADSAAINDAIRSATGRRATVDAALPDNAAVNDWIRGRTHAGEESSPESGEAATPPSDPDAEPTWPPKLPQGPGAGLGPRGAAPVTRPRRSATELMRIAMNRSRATGSAVDLGELETELDSTGR